MPENAFKNNSSWTELHEAFCYQHHIPPAGKSLWQWLIRQGETSTEVEPDISEFNAWVAKVRGKGYSHNYLKQIFNQLVEHRVIRIVKQYSWKIFKLVLRPIAWLNPPKKKPEKKLQLNNSSYTLPPSNALSAEQGLNSSSNSSTHISTEEFEEFERQHDILKTCAEYEIYFDPNKASTRHLFEFDIDYIRQALKHFVKRGGHKEITNPQGWLIDCLRDCYWQDELFGLSEFIEVLTSWFPNNLPRDY